MSTDMTDDLQLLCGKFTSIDRHYCDIPFSNDVKDFLAALSEMLLKHPAVRDYPDLATFAFYCRKANLEQLEQQLAIQETRLGWGKALHIAPSNIPVNFAYSFVFGLLAGNSNVVRLPSKSFPQIQLFCEILTELFANPRFSPIAEHNAFVSFSKESLFLQKYLHDFDALLVWGGDRTVSDIRALSRSARCIEVAFTDRYSFAVLDAISVSELDNKQLQDLCRQFYNDTFLVDQNACSSPNLVLWQGDRQSIVEAKERFWMALQDYALNHYPGGAIQIMDKQILLLKYLEQYSIPCRVQDYGGLVMVATLQDIVDYNHQLKGVFGLFFELEDVPLAKVLPFVNKRYQTLTYFGLLPAVIEQMLLSNRCCGIDRVVPVGSALDIGVQWDGYDLIRTLSRVISIK